VKFSVGGLPVRRLRKRRRCFSGQKYSESEPPGGSQSAAVLSIQKLSPFESI
jgi:hypothetical protein